MYKRLYFIGIPVYILLLLLSLLYYKERTIFLDSAYNIFHIIKDGNFCIQHYRFGDVFSQLLPLVAVRAGLPLGVVLGAYSVGFVLCYLLAYVICGSVLKRYDIAVVILLLNILFVADTFYFMQSQLPEAMVILLLVFAMLDGKQAQAGVWRWGLLAAATVTVVFFHPVALFAMVFCTAFLLLGRQPSIDKKPLYTVGGIYIVAMVVKFLVFKTPYENHSMSGMKNFITQFPDYITLYSNKRFLHDCATKYYWVPVLFVIIAGYYVRRREHRKLGLFAVSFLGYLMLVNISYPFPVTPEFYMENLYLPLAVFLAFPFVLDVLPALERRRLAMPVMLLILITGSLRLYATHTTYTARLNYERCILDTYGDKKVVLQATKADVDTLQMLWGTPYELLLLSACERHKPASIIIDENARKFDWAGGLTNGLVVNWDVFLYRDIDKRYFRFEDTVRGYRMGR